MTDPLPASMQAVVLTALGALDHLAWTELPVPAPAPGEVLIRVATVAANRQDIVTALGRFPNPDLVLPHVLGMDPAGLVVALGEGVTEPAVGTRVVAKPAVACGRCPSCLAREDDGCDRVRTLGVHRPGGMAEFVAVPAQNAVPLPAGVAFATASAMAHSVPVAQTALRRVGLRADETLFVDGAAGAVGSAVVQLAALWGVRVIAGVGGRDGVDWLQGLPEALRPARIIDYTAAPAFGPLIREVAPAGVDVFVETAAAPALWMEALGQVARHGRVAVIGAHAGPVAELNLNWLFRQRVSIVGCSGSSAEAFREAVALAGDRRISVRIDSILPLGEARTALGRLTIRQNRGKVVLRVADLPDSA
jgi:NADPH:quinone reductase-like Zn-dependent oxidoreductase